LCATEACLRKLNGNPPVEPDPPQFKYKYVDIYKNFFEKSLYKDNKIFYETVPEKRLYRNNNMEFPATKDPETLRFFILGGSVAEDFFKFPLGTFLKSLIPDKNFEIINCGMGSYDSYRASLVAREIIAYSPDLVIVISGNNENYDRYKINLTAYYINKFLRKLWVYRNLQGYVASWIKEHQPDYSIIRVREKHLRIYEKNIRAIVRTLQTKNVPLVLCTIPVNFKDCPPGSDPILDKQFFLSSFLSENKDYDGAIRGFQKYLTDNPDNQDNRLCWYFLGRSYEGIKDYSKAKEYYLKARDWGFATDGAGSTSNEIIRKICRDKKVVLGDLEKLFMQVSPNGLCGRELFYDYCHLYPGSYSLFAECIIQAIFENKKLCVNLFGKTKAIPESLLSPGKQRDFFHDGDTDLMVWTTVWRIFEDKINKIDSNEVDWACNEQILSYSKTLYLMDPDIFWKLQFMEESIVDEFSQNPWIKDFFVIKYKIYSKILWSRLLYYIGETYRRLGQYHKALTLFDKSVSLNGTDHLPYLGRALTHYALNAPRKIILEDFKQAEKVVENEQAKRVVQYYYAILGL
jgi:tetratricopeptide (TPR) repeat protein